MSRIRTWAMFLAFAAGGLTAEAQPGVVIRAMQDELARSMNELWLEDLEQPYFVSYAVREIADVRITAAMGGESSSQERAN